MRIGKLETLVYSESVEELLYANRPVCRRCGRKVGNVETRLARDEDALHVWFSCHGMSLLMAVTRAGAEHIKELWPTHVFEYEATSFGSWDGNGAPV